ncbi:YtxH domain-containing protein [Ramlibacter algicola]|uniref:YtxH domain-containing protein n=1 Tax=Ramlibacter algicola TaxID=2795217 RepID=A0A934UQ87_9BURK|nr:YtxH domain-containing protein [Ramlibacter algicola]MBK0392364.1 YtxH domain-containing protein [Ramlibacter algicola]
MHRPLIAIACALALSTPVLAQQGTGSTASTEPPRHGTPEPQGDSFFERVKNAFKSLGEKAKPAAETAAGKGREIKDNAVQAGGQLKEKAAPTIDTAKEKASEGLDKAKDVATDVKDDTKETAKAARHGDTSVMGAPGSQPPASSPQR